MAGEPTSWDAFPTMDITERYDKTLALDRTPPTDAPDWIETIDNPYLHGLFAPTTVEREADALPVLEGAIPPELFGAYFRNGPNNRFAPKNRYHWFDGDGMVHGIWFENGQARYRNRWIRTEGFERETEVGDGIWPGVLGPFDFSLPIGPIKDTANTDLIVHQGRLMALWYESGELYALDPQTLDTLDRVDFDGQLPGRVSAHSKVCPHTGDFIFFRYGDEPPYMTYGVVRPDGSVHHTDITLYGPRRPHDIGMTPNFSVLHDFPVFFDPEVFKKTGKRIPLFHPEVPTRFGIIPRFGSDEDVQWFEFEPCYMLHVVNCWEEDGWIIQVGCRTDDPTLQPNKADGKIAAMLSGLKLQANLYVWGINPTTGEKREGPMDDLNAEFPMIHPGMVGVKNRFSYHARIPHEIPAAFHGIVKYDLETGTPEVTDYGDGIFGSEAPFIPRPGATEEDDGWLVTFVTHVDSWASQCWIYDARNLSSGPIAKVGLPGRVPAGFHATWLPGSPS